MVPWKGQSHWFFSRLLLRPKQLSPHDLLGTQPPFLLGYLAYMSPIVKASSSFFAATPLLHGFHILSPIPPFTIALSSSLPRIPSTHHTAYNHQTDCLTEQTKQANQTKQCAMAGLSDREPTLQPTTSSISPLQSIPVECNPITGRRHLKATAGGMKPPLAPWTPFKGGTLCHNKPRDFPQSGA